MTSLAPTGVAPPTTRAESSSSKIAGDLDTFLTLLTTQLQNQDPLSPVETEQFTQQLVQFSQVEQQIESNRLLESLVQQQTSSAVSFLGQTAVFESPVATLTADDPAKFEVTLPPGASKAEAFVRDARGNVVATLPLTAPFGSEPRTLTFDGQLTNGRTAAPGPYSLDVRATGPDGASLSGAEVRVRETITGIDLTGQEPLYLTRSGPRPFSSIERVVAS